MTSIGGNSFLDKPWDLHYGPDGFLWITERQTGVVVRVNPETAERDELIQIPDVHSTAGQDGLLGIALHDGLLDDNPYVYVSFTYLVQGQRQQKLVRYTYQLNDEDGSLSSPQTILDMLPASNDHNSGRLIFGPDEKLYYTIGDQGGNQYSNYCNPILSQVLPSQEEIDQQDWTYYPGKILRINIDGSIPEDNPVFAGVQSHIYSYGHRNPQGIVWGNNGLLYSDEHGPRTDDEVNIIYAGSNYGWPNVAGYQDDQAYDYCDWSSAPDCESLDYSVSSCPPELAILEESSFAATDYQEPLMSLFAVTDDFDFNNPDCENASVCRPNVAPSSIGIYESHAIPSWKNSLLISSLKRGRIYRLKLNEEGTAIIGDTLQHFYTQNRYRDIVIHPDGKSLFIITDETGNTSSLDNLSLTNDLQNPGAILKFTLQEAVSTNDPDRDAPFQVWPNPAQHRIHLDVKAATKSPFRAEIINPHGEVVQSLPPLQTGLHTIAVDQLPAGIYFIRLSSKDRSWQKRIVLF